MLDSKVKAAGMLAEDFAFPPKSFDAKGSAKPDDWVDEADVADPSDTKPVGWDQVLERIPDLSAEKPDDHEDDIDGEWEPPTMDNPEYKGEWVQRRIPNPDFKGAWVPEQIANPDYHATQGQ